MNTSAATCPQKVMVVLGTRPEVIKLAPLVLALKNDPRFELITVFSGQHKDMAVSMMAWFGITPDHTMDVMQPKQPLAFLSGKLLAGLHTLLEAERPDIVVVQGDTTTAFIAALSAYYAYDYYIRNEIDGEHGRHTCRIAHVEAGLRTGDIYKPFPEEINRALIGRMAYWHFAPTETALQALARENITHNVFVTGNTAIDALFSTVERLKANPRPFPAGVDINRPFVLITGHRRESYGEGFQHICDAIRQLAERYPAYDFVYPVHLNQHVQKPVNDMLGKINNIKLLKPLPYEDFVNLMQHAKLLLTDSGGLQEEGPALGKPVLVMREVTERPEGVVAGTARLVGTTTTRIVDNVTELLENPEAYAAMSKAVNPYGDGQATQRILNILHGENGADNVFRVKAA